MGDREVVESESGATAGPRQYSAECWAMVADFFRDLRFSIYLLFGFVFGTALSVPFVLDYFRMLFGEELSGGAMVAVGVYLFLVGILGTWMSLGAFGVWAGRCGGRPLRLIVQVLGILLTAWMTLPIAVLATIVLMWWLGRKPKE
jgi:hypothetical protein